VSNVTDAFADALMHNLEQKTWQVSRQVILNFPLLKMEAGHHEKWICQEHYARKDLYMIGSKATNRLVLIQWTIFLMERAYKISWSRQKLVRNCVFNSGEGDGNWWPHHDLHVIQCTCLVLHKEAIDRWLRRAWKIRPQQSSHELWPHSELKTTAKNLRIISATFEFEQHRVWISEVQ